MYKLIKLVNKSTSLKNMYINMVERLIIAITAHTSGIPDRSPFNCHYHPFLLIKLQ